MTTSMTLELLPPPPTATQLRTGRTTPTHLTGFSYAWFRTVTGFNPEKHCAACFVGERDPRITKRIATRTQIEISCPGHSEPPKMGGAGSQMTQQPYFYLCAGARLYDQNLHVAWIYEPGESFTAKTFNGFTISVTNAARVTIQPLPADHPARALGDRFTRCRNFQFGVQIYGYPGKEVQP
jgi:hypothetical protein